MNDPFTPHPADSASGSARSSAAPFTNSGGKPVANSANTSASTAPTGTARSAPASRPASASDPAAAASASTLAAASASAAVRAAVAAEARRGKRGDVRAAILVLLADRAMHGYEMIQEISERSGGLWRPSPGSVYPTLQLLVDEGLIVGTESEGSKRLFELTDEGRAAAEKVETPPWEEIAEGVDPGAGQPAHRAQPADGCGRAVRVRRDRGAAAAHRRHRQQRPPRGVQHPRRNRVVTDPVGISPAGLVYALSMQTFPLGSFHVGRVGFGAMQLPGPGVFGPPRDHDQALAVLRRAIELGINHIDTAQFYGPNVSNELIREALHPYPADLALVSKVGARRDEPGGWLPAQEPDELRAEHRREPRARWAPTGSPRSTCAYPTPSGPQRAGTSRPRTVRPSAHHDDQGPRRRASSAASG